MHSNILIINDIVLALQSWGRVKSLRACDSLGKFADNPLCGINLMSNLMSVEI